VCTHSYKRIDGNESICEKNNPFFMRSAFNFFCPQVLNEQESSGSTFGSILSNVIDLFPAMPEFPLQQHLIKLELVTQNWSSRET
jgi:hypothetical protein